MLQKNCKMLILKGNHLINRSLPECEKYKKLLLAGFLTCSFLSAFPFQKKKMKQWQEVDKKLSNILILKE